MRTDQTILVRGARQLVTLHGPQGIRRGTALRDIGIIPALSWFSRETEKTYPGTGVEFSGGVEDWEVPEKLKIVLFRIAQESVTNAIRHGNAMRIRIDLEKKDVWLRLSVRDNGKGFDSMKHGEASGSHGIGLNSMQQRVDSTGGIFSIRSCPEGTTVKAEWKTGDWLSIFHL